MIDSVALDVTPVSGPSYFQEYRDKSRTPLSDRGKSHVFDMTKAMVAGPVLIAKAVASTPTVAELHQNLQMQVAEDEVIVIDDPATTAKGTRSVLLAKRYAGKASKEDNARLDILTERIRLLSPRVTKPEVEILASIVDHAEVMSARLEDMRRKYGI